MFESKDSPSGNISAANPLPVEGRFQEIQSGSRLMKERKLFCTICDIDFSTFPSLRDHLRAFHTVKITRTSHFCQPCGKHFPSVTRFRTHLHREHTVEKIDACVKCGFKLSRVVPTRISGDAYLDHYCVGCQEGTKANKAEMAEDSKTQSDGKTETPPDCDGSELTGLKTHKSRKNISCRMCQESFVSPVILRDRLLMQHGSKSEDKPHLCAICQKAFLTLNKLIIHHQIEHVRKKPFACGSCQEGFVDKSQLKSHLLTHVKNEPEK